MTENHEKSQNIHRIGAISALAGIPTTTLRIWESRYGAFSPLKTAGSHRLYSESDLLKATLLKQICDYGHAISKIANLDIQGLNELLQKYRKSQLVNAQAQLANNTVEIAIIGLPLAARIESKKFTLSYRSNAIQVTDIFYDLGAAQKASFETRPHMLLAKVISLDANTCSDIYKLVARESILQTIVLYSYGQENVIQAMKRSGIMVRREPISDYDLADLISSVLLVDRKSVV